MVVYGKPGATFPVIRIDGPRAEPLMEARDPAGPPRDMLVPVHSNQIHFAAVDETKSAHAIVPFFPGKKVLTPLETDPGKR
jgi:hypothetical protein